MNRIYCLTSILVLAFSARVVAQDDIIMRNDDVIKAKVEEVGVDVIRYHKADNMDGPIYDLPKANVYMIVYANGSRDVINPRGGESPAPVNDAPPVADAPIRTAPPELPVYEQPYCPYEGYIWTPGYWAFGPLGYYWVPGVWVSPPRRGYLWTPGYWGFAGGYYGWHEGYWGEHIGFYGGVNYGYGYGGSGYYGGRWDGGVFRYNTAVSRVDVTVVHTTYVDNTVVVHENNTVVNHSSFNGEGGVRALATPSEKMAMSENHVQPTNEQQSHVSAARADKSQYVSANHGTPATAAMSKPNGERYTTQGHINTAAHSAPESNTQHSSSGSEPHSSPAQSHPSESSPQHAQPTAQPQHTAQPASQPHTSPAQNHPASAPKSKPAPRPAASKPAARESHH